jgi:hypothetical protein
MNTKTSFKLNDNVEFLEKSMRNWRYGKIIEINKQIGTYKIYSGTDIFWTKEIQSKNKNYLETI